MKKNICVVLPALFYIFLSFFLPSSFLFAQDGGGNKEISVSSYEELQVQLGKNNASVILDADIIVPADKHISLDNIHVNTASHGFIVEGTLELGPNLILAGEGVSRPVIEAVSGGCVYVAYSLFAESPQITVTKAEGRALVFREGSKYDPYAYTSLRITAKNGTAIEAEIPLTMDCLFIEASKGIVSSEKVSLFLSSIQAGNSSVQAPNIVADTCVLSPQPTKNAKIIHRKISALSTNKMLLGLGEGLPEYWGGALRTTAVLHAEGEEDIRFTTFVKLAAPTLDTEKPGVYPVTVSTETWLNAFDLIPEGMPLFTIEVRDLRIPEFYKSSSYEGKYNLEFLYQAKDKNGLTLWRSDDEGKTWFDVTDSAIMEFNDGSLILTFDKAEDHPVQLAWEVAGLGESKVIRITWSNYNIGINVGGDRNVGDRGETTLPPRDGGDTETPPPVSGSDPGPAVKPPAAVAPAKSAKITKVKPVVKATTATTKKPAKKSTMPKTKSASVTQGTADETVTVTGLRLGVMISANPNYVSFPKGDMRISLPTPYLAGLHLNASDILTIRLYQTDETHFAAFLAVNGSSIDYSYERPFLLSIPWSGEAIACTIDDGAPIDADLESEDGQAVFSLYQTGSYTLTDTMAAAANASLSSGEDSADETQSSADKWPLPAIIIGIALLIVGALFVFTVIRKESRWRRRRRYRQKYGRRQ